MNSAITIHEAAGLQERLQAVIAGLDVSPETRRKYAARVSHISEFIQNQLQDGVPACDWLVNYKRVLQSQYSAATAAAYFAAARAIFVRLHSLGFTPDLTAGVKGIQTARGHKRAGVNRSEAAAIKDALQTACVRTRALAALLLLQGFRQCEVVRLNVEDLDLGSGTLLVHGKGRTDKETVLLNPATVAVLRDYLTAYGYTQGALFRPCDRASKNKPAARLTTRGLNKIIKALFNTAGVDKCVHGLRHHFVTVLLDVLQGDVVRVQQWTRHRSLEMLQVYNDERAVALTAPTVFAAITL